MKRGNQVLSGLFSILILLSLGCENLTNEPRTISKQFQKISEVDSIFNNFDINDIQAFGGLNPDAPEETKQFHFMVGKFICTDSLLTNGKWATSKGTWETHYNLNGYAVRDVYRNSSYAGESIRFFNTSKQKWDVFFFGMPDQFTGLWEGESVDGTMVMKQFRKGPNGENHLSKLTFYDITKKSFEWKGELIDLDTQESSIFWTISAKRSE